MEKLYTFENLLNSCYCSLDLFLENYGKDISDLRKDIFEKIIQHDDLETRTHNEIGHLLSLWQKSVQ